MPPEILTTEYPEIDATSWARIGKLFSSDPTVLVSVVIPTDAESPVFQSTPFAPSDPALNDVVERILRDRVPVIELDPASPNFHSALTLALGTSVRLLLGELDVSDGDPKEVACALRAWYHDAFLKSSINASHNAEFNLHIMRMTPDGECAMRLYEATSLKPEYSIN